MKRMRIPLALIVGLPLFVFGFLITTIFEHKDDSLIIPSFEKAHADAGGGAGSEGCQGGGSCCSV